MTLVISLSVGAMAQEEEAANVAASQDSTTKAKVDPSAVQNEASKDGVSKEENAALSNIVGGQSGWRLQGAVTHIPALRSDQEHTTDILTRADYTFNKKHRVRVQQFFTKFYSVYNQEDELKPADTLLAHYYTLDYKPFGANLLWQTRATLPVSNQSARDDLITRVSGSMIATKGFLNNRLIGFFIPYGTYHWYEFNQSKSGGLRPWYTVGASIAGLYFITDKLAFYAGGTYNVETQRQSQFDQAPSQVPNGNYRFDLDLSYQFTGRFAGSLSYVQGANYLEDGRFEVVAFDDQNSRVSVGLTYIY